MKKTGLFKIIMFVLLGIVVATWIFSASYFNESISDLGMYNVGFFDFFQLFIGSFEFTFFVSIFLFLLSVGALYGVLIKTGKYRALIDRIVWNFKGAELIFLLLVAFVIALLTSLFDYQLMIFVFFPFLISIILAMGYDKVTTFLATFGATLVGTIGSTFGNNTAGTIAGIISTKLTDGILYRFIVLALSLAVLFVFLARAKRTKNIKAQEDQIFIGEKIQTKKSVAPVIIVMSMIFVLLVLGCTSWNDSFGVSVFDKINTAVTEFEVKLPYFHITIDGIDTGLAKTAIFGKILGTTPAFGTWSYADMTMVCLVAALLIGLIYGFKFKRTFSFMAEGAQKMLKPALLVLLCYTVIYFAGNTMFFTTIAHYILSITGKFSVFFGSVVMALGSALYVDILYIANYVIPVIANKGADAKTLSILCQGFYGIVLLVAPTSMFLALGLSYLGLPYTKWIKKAWMFILALVVVVMAVSLVVNYAL